MEVKQIYSIVNSVVGQGLGNTALTVVDTQGLISLGNTVLSSSTNTECFLNTLVQRIGKTIISYRQYKSKFDDLIVDDFEWGAILQKIKVQMPTSEADQSFGLENGESVDHYKIAKPDVKQKLFVTETPYQFHITIQRVHLKEAFQSESAMGGFIQAIFGEVQNAIELALEELGRLALSNYIAEVQNTSRAVNLLKNYNDEKGTTLTVAQARDNADFIRYAIGQINLYSRKLQDMSTLYNDGTTTRHTPKELQKLYVMADFQTNAETIVQYSAFHDGYVKLDKYKELTYLQSIQEPNKVLISRASDGSTVNVENIIGCLFDKEALGIYKKDMWTATTPFNAGGGYTNTYWHMKELYFNDLSENFVMFYMA